MKAEPENPAYPGHQGAPYPPGYAGAPAAYQYGYPMAGVIPQQPVMTTHHNVMVVPQPAHKDYLGLSIMNLILCCLPLGIAATIYSCKTQDSTSRGDMISAESNSRTAFMLNMVALGLGLSGHVAWIAYVIYASVAIVLYYQLLQRVPVEKTTYNGR